MPDNFATSEHSLHRLNNRLIRTFRLSLSRPQDERSFGTIYAFTMLHNCSDFGLPDDLLWATSKQTLQTVRL